VWRKNAGELMYANLYGPTEITDVCTYYIVDREFDDNDKMPIGIPCENMKAVILTEDNRKAKRITVYYSDGSFQDFYPSK
jgi:non-ribosomal peptide synthetase component F